MHLTRIGRIVAAVTVAALVSVGLAAGPVHAQEAVRVVSGHVWLGDANRSATTGEVVVSAKTGSATYTASTDVNGDYSLPVTFFGAETRVLLTFTYTGPDGFSGAVYPNYPIGAYSGTRSIDVISDRPGTDITLPAAVTVSGQVLLAPAWTPAGVGTVAVTWERMNTENTGFGPESAPVLVDADGMYSFTLPGGYYYFRYVYVGPGGDYAELPFTSPGTNVPVTVFDHDITLTTKTMYLEDSINGRVTLGQFDGIFAGAGDVRVTANYRSHPNNPWTRLDDKAVLTDASGRFTITDIADGYYSMNYEWIGSPAGAYESALSRGAFTYFYEHFEAAVDVSLSRLGSISGRIYLGDVAHPAPAGSVVVDVGSNGFFSGNNVVPVGAGGQFTLTGVGENSFWDVRAHYIGDGPYGYGFTFDVALGAQDVTGVQIVLQPYAGFRGRITDIDGEPLADADVQLLSLTEDGVFSLQSVSTDADGRYDFRNLAPGQWSVVVSADGYETTSWPDRPVYFDPLFFTLVDKQFRTDIDVRLAPEGSNATVTGTITSADPSVIASGDVSVEVFVPDSTMRVWSWTGYGVYVDPATGDYELDLPAGTFRVQAAYLGEYGEATVRSPTFSFEAGDSATFGAEIRPFDRDLNEDGAGDILYRDSLGQLMTYVGNGVGGFAGKTLIAKSWGGFTAVVHAGDFDTDGFADVIARSAAGYLYLYRGNGAAGFLEKRTISTSSFWKTQTAIISPGDFDGDGSTDLISRDSTGYLWLHPGNGTGGLKTKIRIGSSGWKAFTAVLPISDFNEDGVPDLAARDASGVLWLYPGNGTGGFKPRAKLGTGWGGMTAIRGIGDFNGDWHPDLIARDATGYLWLYKGNGGGGFAGKVKIGSSGWKAFKIAG